MDVSACKKRDSAGIGMKNAALPHVYLPNHSSVRNLKDLIPITQQKSPVQGSEQHRRTYMDTQIGVLKPHRSVTCQITLSRRC